MRATANYIVDSAEGCARRHTSRVTGRDPDEGCRGPRARIFIFKEPRFPFIYVLDAVHSGDNHWSPNKCPTPRFRFPRRCPALNWSHVPTRELMCLSLARGPLVL